MLFKVEERIFPFLLLVIASQPHYGDTSGPRFQLQGFVSFNSVNVPGMKVSYSYNRRQHLRFE